MSEIKLSNSVGREKVRRMIFSKKKNQQGGYHSNEQVIWQDRAVSASFYTSEPSSSLAGALRNGLLHKDDGPALLYFEKEVLICEQHWSQGNLHREGGPAVIDFELGIEEWRQGGQLHREDGPAYKEEGVYQEWWIEGKLSRNPSQGPAVIHYEAGIEQYWENGLPVIIL